MKFRSTSQVFKRKNAYAPLFSIGFMLVGSILLLAVKAAPSDSSIEPESGTVLVPAQTVSDAAASSGMAVQFNAAPPSGGSTGFCDTYPQLPSSKPDASNTGVPAGTTLTTYTGPMPKTTAGTVIAERDATIAALRAEVERLERDAGRYRVLRSLLAGDAPMIRKAQRIIDSDYVWQMDEELDAAIAQTKERA